MGIENTVAQELLTQQRNALKGWFERIPVSKEKNNSYELARVINEFIGTELDFVSDMLQLRRVLEPISQDKSVDSKMRDLINEYVVDLDTLLEIYSTLNLQDPLNNAEYNFDQLTEEIVLRLEKFFIEQGYAEALGNLIDKVSKMTELSVQDEFRVAVSPIVEKEGMRLAVRDSILKPVQRMLKYSLLIKQMNKPLIREMEQSFSSMASSSETSLSTPPNTSSRSNSPADISTQSSSSSLSKSQGSLSGASRHSLHRSHHSLTRIDSYITELSVQVNERKRAQENAVAASSAASKQRTEVMLEADGKLVAEKALETAPTLTQQRRTFALHRILEMQINNPQRAEKYPKEYLAAYLKTMLGKGCNDAFYFSPTGRFMVLKNDLFKKISEALGSLAEIDPAKFDAKALDDLYVQERNPLWLVLKSTIPVSNDKFSVEQKIQAYQDVAIASIKKQFDKTGKYELVLAMQKAAFAVAKEHGALDQFIKSFGPESKLGKYIAKKIKGHDSQEQMVSQQDIDAALSSTESSASTSTLSSFKSRLSLVREGVTSFTDFCEGFSERFQSAKNSGIQKMITFMDTLKSQTISDERKFELAGKKMKTIADKQGGTAASNGVAFWRRGSESDVQNAYQMIKAKDFDLNDPATQFSLMGVTHSSTLKAR